MLRYYCRQCCKETTIKMVTWWKGLTACGCHIDLGQSDVQIAYDPDHQDMRLSHGVRYDDDQ